MPHRHGIQVGSNADFNFLLSVLEVGTFARLHVVIRKGVELFISESSTHLDIICLSFDAAINRK